ncbi:hypothetical protein HYW76_01275 [Candidatus Pacearchaeota archaeon]|nr:hypothetical protein [Candidatus Pacearchaeota archaeon]
MIKKILKEAENSRRMLKSGRKIFFSENTKNFEKNINKILNTFKKEIPNGWKVYLTAGNFIGKEKIMPYDYDSFSSTNLIAASEKQGKEIMIFINKSRLGFLSLPALIPIIIHELEHVKQAANNPKKYLLSMTDDKLSIKLEAEAENAVKKLPEELRKQEILESVVYCFETEGWNAAVKMADFFINIEKMYGGGYLRNITSQEYEALLKARKKNNINIFIDFLIHS